MKCGSGVYDFRTRFSSGASKYGSRQSTATDGSQSPDVTYATSIPSHIDKLNLNIPTERLNTKESIRIALV